MPLRIFLRVVAVGVFFLCSILQVHCRSMYRHPLDCALDEYYNPATHHCEGCKELCQPHRDTLGQCSRLCPGYQTVVIPILDQERKTTLTTINDLQEHNKDKEFESTIRRYMYGMAAAVALIATVTVMLVVCVVQQRKENKKLMKKLLSLDHEDGHEGHPGQQAGGKPTDDPPSQAVTSITPPSRATQQEVEPLLTDPEPRKPVPEEGDGDTCVPTAPSSRVAIYSTDTNPHDLHGSLREDQGTATTTLETEI